MSGTIDGAKRMMETTLRKYGRTEDGKSALHVRAGALGGKNGHTGGFAANRELARTAGAKGGIISRRAKKTYKSN